MAYTDYFDEVQSIYIAYYQRPADPAGLRYWAQRLNAEGGNLDAIIDAFSNSPEAKSLYTETDPLKLVDSVYQALFGRPADNGADNFYVKALEAGKFPDGRPATLGRVAIDVLNGAQGDDRVAIDNKLKVANDFTQIVDGRPLTDPEFGFDGLAVTYKGDADAAAAREFLKGVTSDPSTVPTQDGVKEVVAEKIADPTDAPVETGKTFTLTQGLDTIAGTSGNDTINAYAFNSVTGANVTTLQSVDSIDGGAGTDTLFIEVKSDGGSPAANLNGTLQGTIKNVEIINIDQTAAASTPMAVDASKLGTAATTITQIGRAGAVTNLAATTTAGFKNISTDVSAAAATGVASVAVALDGLADSNGNTPAATKVSVSGDALNAVTVTGTVKDGNDTGTTVDKIALAATVGKDVQTLTVNSAVGATITVKTDSTATKAFTTLNASGSTGAIAFGGTSVDNASTPATGYKVANITTGSGNDVVTLKADTNAASGTTAAVGASVTTGAGNDQITVDTANSSLSSTTGATTVDAGAGDDQVAITTRSSGKLTVNLGDGSDTFTSSVAITGTDSIDAGAGSDTLLLSLVGSANIGAFSNFETFDAAALGKTLDVEILAAKNTVTEFVASGDVGSAASLTNIGAGVGFRATGNMTTNTLTLTQKAAGALTVTLDADSTSTTAQNDTNLKVDATNATSLKAVFGVDSGFVQTSSTTNDQTIALTGDKATSLEVVSGGTNATNVLNYTGAQVGTTGADYLTSVSISGSQALSFNYTAGTGSATAIASIDASAMTGGLTASLAAVKDTGTIKLGSGTDVITVTTASTGATGFESIQNFEKTAAVAVSTATADATAAAAAIAAADKIALGDGTFAVADADYNGSTTGTGTLSGGAVDKGVLTFTGAGPATLADAISIANLAADTNGEAVVFEYVGNSYVFVQGTTDIVVQLTGITGVTNFVEDGTSNNFFIV